MPLHPHPVQVAMMGNISTTVVDRDSYIADQIKIKTHPEVNQISFSGRTEQVIRQVTLLMTPIILWRTLEIVRRGAPQKIRGYYCWSDLQ